MFELLEHRYQEKWLGERREAEKKQREKIIKKVELFTKMIMLAVCNFYSPPPPPPPPPTPEAAGEGV